MNGLCSEVPTGISWWSSTATSPGHTKAAHFMSIRFWASKIQTSSKQGYLLSYFPLWFQLVRHSSSRNFVRIQKLEKNDLCGLTHNCLVRYGPDHIHEKQSPLSDEGKQTHLMLEGVFIKVSIAVIKLHSQKQLGMERVYSILHFVIQYPGKWRQDHGGEEFCSLACSSWLAGLAFF